MLSPDGHFRRGKFYFTYNVIAQIACAQWTQPPGLQCDARSAAKRMILRLQKETQTSLAKLVANNHSMLTPDEPNHWEHSGGVGQKSAG